MISLLPGLTVTNLTFEVKPKLVVYPVNDVKVSFTVFSPYIVLSAYILTELSRLFSEVQVINLSWAKGDPTLKHIDINSMDICFMENVLVV